jgi:hypothetical protein
VFALLDEIAKAMTAWLAEQAFFPFVDAPR